MARGKKTGGRDFAPGNTFGALPQKRRNPLAAAIKNISDDDAASMVTMAVKLAKAGDMGAFGKLLDFVVPKPAQHLLTEDVTRRDEARAKVAERILGADPDTQRALLEVIHGSNGHSGPNGRSS